MKYLSANQRVLCLVMFSIMPCLFIYPCPATNLALAKAELRDKTTLEESISKAEKGCVYDGLTTRSCDASLQGVVCKDWETIFEDSFEEGFPGPRWGTEGQPFGYCWRSTNCTASHGKNSIWCADPLLLCNGLYCAQIKLTAGAVYYPLSIADYYDIFRVSFDYKLKSKNQNVFAVGLFWEYPYPGGYW